MPCDDAMRRDPTTSHPLPTAYVPRALRSLPVAAIAGHMFWRLFTCKAASSRLALNSSKARYSQVELAHADAHLGPNPDPDPDPDADPSLTLTLTLTLV